MAVSVEEGVKIHREAIYNRLKDKNPSPIELEMACFRSIPFGHRLKGEFCISMSKLQWDWLYLEKDGAINYWFKRMVTRGLMSRVTYIVGSASAGKSTACCIIGYNLWKVSPWDTMFIITSTDKEALDAKAWGELKKLHDTDRHKIGIRVDHEDLITLQPDASKRDKRTGIKAIAFPQGSEGQKAVGKIQGRKGQNVIWLCDELAHMDGEAVETARGNLDSAPLHVFMGCSNKPDEGDPMYRMAAPDPDKYPMGWATPGLSDKTEWETADGICLYMDGEKSPNMKADPTKPEPFPMLTTRAFIERTVQREKGRDGPNYWRYVKAFPVQGESHDRVVDPRVLARFRATDDPVWAGSGWTTVSGLDAAWTKGGDDCTADFARLGIEATGTKILAHERDVVRLSVKVSGKGTFEEQIAEAYIEEAKKRDCHVVAIDISGGGGRIALAVRNAADKHGWSLEIISVDAGGSPDENAWYQVGDKRRNGKEMFDRRVSELWYGYRMLVDQEVIRGCHLQSSAIREMCDRRVRNDERKRWEVEKKDEMKKRHGGKSPDSAEARILCGYAARKKGLGAAKPVEATKKVILSEYMGTPEPKQYSHSYSTRRRYS